MENRIALVTGGMGGIGTAICQHLANMGAKVIATYYRGGDHESAKAWQAQQNYPVSIVYVDVSDFDSCGKMLSEIEKEYQHIDILVNNAGITRDNQLRKMSIDDWQMVIKTNLDSIFNVTRHVINGMIERNYGRIINIASINGERGQFGQTNYTAAKSGIYGFTKSLALEVARKGITVNAVSPGYIATKMVMAVPEKIRDKIIEQIPVGRLGQPDEVARLVAFLAQEESGFITGADFSVNGGQYM